MFNNGSLIVTRRPMENIQKSVECFEVCPYCKGFYSKKCIKKHFKLCLPEENRGHRNVRAEGRRILGKIHLKASEVMKNEIFPAMRDDLITRIIRFDELVILFGNNMCQKYRSEHHFNMIRSRLRLLGRFLIEMKTIKPKINELAASLTPDNYDYVIEAVNKVANLNTQGTKYYAPSSASQLGTLLKKCSKLLIVECIKQKDSIKKKSTEDFLCIYEQDFASSINKTVLENQAEMKRNKKINLPSIDDIKLLNNYLSAGRKKYYHILKTRYAYSAWRKLLEFCLTSVQIFNRRRAGEIERIHTEDYKNYQSVNEETSREIYNSLSDESKKAAEMYVRFVIRGKLGRSVAVLLHTELCKCFDLLLKYRETAKVLPDNPYLFGLPNVKNKNCHLSATVLMRKYSIACRAQNPNLLRGTQLRKHIATHSVLLNLSECEVTDLANFMGHSEKIHKDHYRIPIIARDIEKMSRLLELAQGATNLELSKPTSFRKISQEATGINLESSVLSTASSSKSTNRQSRSGKFNQLL